MDGANEEQILEELRAAAPRIFRYADWTREMLELNQQGIRTLPPGIVRKTFSGARVREASDSGPSQISLVGEEGWQ